MQEYDIDHHLVPLVATRTQCMRYILAWGGEMLPESGVTKMPGASRGEVIGSENFLGSKIQIAGGCMREMSLVEVVVGGSEVVTRRLEMRFERTGGII